MMQRLLCGLVGIALAFGASQAQGQPMVVYSSDGDLFVGTGEPGSFTSTNQGAVLIRDIAIDPATRTIYYIDSQNNNIGIANSAGQRIGVLTESPVNPFVMQIVGGVLYYSDRDQVPTIRTVNLSTLAEGSLPLTDDLRHFVIDTKNGKVFYTTDSSTDQRVRSANLDGSGMTEFFRPTTGTSALELYGDALLRSDFGNSGRITSLTLPTLTPSTVIRPNVTSSGAAVDMASDVANNVYYYINTRLNVAGARLFRRTVTATLNTDETLIADIPSTTLAALDVLEPEIKPTLTPATVLTAPPVLVSKTANSITVMLQDFADVALTASASLSPREQAQLLRAVKKTAKPTFIYEVRVDPVEKGNVKRITSKKNVLTVNNLKPGSYALDYRATILVKKTAAQKKKAKAAGKKGVALNFNKKGSTNFSPPLTVTLP